MAEVLPKTGTDMHITSKPSTFLLACIVGQTNHLQNFQNQKFL